MIDLNYDDVDAAFGDSVAGLCESKLARPVGKTAEWTFDVDKATHVSVSGATKKTMAAKDAKEPLEITQYVKVGDTVNVKYHDMGATKHAADVSVRSSAPGAVKK